MAFDAAGRRVITSSHDDTVRVWDVASGREIARLEGVGSEPLCAIFAPDEERVLTGHRDGRIRIWDLDDQKMIAELIGHSEYVYSLARSPDGETVISGSGDCTVRIWGARSPPELRRAFAERAELATELAPRVETLFEELKDPTAIAQCVRREFEGRRLEVALQLVLAESVGRRAP